MIDVRPHRSHEVHADLSHFWVITVLSNSVRFKRRYELYHPFAAMVESTGAKLITVECAFGDRVHMVTDSSNPRHVQLRTFEELWHKENMVNIGVRRAMQLDPLVDKVAWIDADLKPMRAARDWFEETWHELQHFKFVQMYEHFMDLDSNYSPLNGTSQSYMATYFQNGMTGPIPNQHCKEHPNLCWHRHRHHRHHRHHKHPINPNSGGNHWFGPPGGAWAADVKALNEIGMLPDKCILGSGDWHFAAAVTESMNPTDPEMINNKYTEYLLEYQTKCNRWIKRDVGVVRGGIFHDNHGAKVNRNYVGRKQILTLNDYDPEKDVKYDHQGLLQLETFTEKQIRLRDEIRYYMRQRNEDIPEFRKT
jgi:hypothetical protein